MMQSRHRHRIDPAHVLAGMVTLTGTMVSGANPGNTGGADVATAQTPVDCNSNGVPDSIELRLLEVCDGLGLIGLGDPTAFVWPKSKHIGFDSVEILVTDDVELLDWQTTSTGGAPPAIVYFEPLGGGRHRVYFDGPIEVREWTTVRLAVAGRNSCLIAEVCFQIAHLPGDVLGDGQVNLADATWFGLLFRESGPLKMADLNGDGEINLVDATKFGQIWSGADNEGTGPNCDGPWAGAGLPWRLPCGYRFCESNDDCDATSFCAKEQGDCWGLGICYERPAACPDVWDPVCGCDGVTYGNECEAAAAGVSVLGAGECPTFCFGNDDCDATSFCAKEVGDCWGLGICHDRPAACPDVWDPVCGCDGQTYGNDCEAAAAGVSVIHAGACF